LIKTIFPLEALNLVSENIKKAISAIPMGLKYETR
jgi:hypothetical protein